MEALHTQGRDDVVRWLLQSWVSQTLAVLLLVVVDKSRLARLVALATLLLCLSLHARCMIVDIFDPSGPACALVRNLRGAFAAHVLLYEVALSNSLPQHYNPLTGNGYGARGLGMSTLVCDWLQRL
jgi:hypothetical protein